MIDPVDAWCQLAMMLSIDELVVAGDFLVRRKQPLATLEQLHDAAAGSTARGIRKLRSALAFVRPGTDSPMETRLRLTLVAAGLPEPVIGHTVTDDAGFIATPDLATSRSASPSSTRASRIGRTVVSLPRTSSAGNGSRTPGGR